MAGGAEQQLLELLSKLDRDRFQPYVLCLYGTRAGRSLHFLDDLHRIGVPVVLLDLKWDRIDKLFALLRMIQIIWQIRPHIVQSVNYHSNLLLRLSRPFLPRLRVITGVFIEYSTKQWRYERMSHWLCDIVVCNSQHLEAQFREKLPYTRVVLIPNGVDYHRFACNSAKSSTAQGHQLDLLMLGRITGQKAPQLLIEALGLLKIRKHLPSWLKVRIVGEIEDPQVYRNLVDRIAFHDLASVVKLFPATHFPENYIRESDVLVLTSLWEGLPGVVLEALAAGRPVIISDAANGSGVIEHGISGWVFPKTDVDALAETLNIVLRLPHSALNEMSNVCQNIAMTYSSQLMSQRYEMLYDSLTARK
jgi:glycosyltransferase involved in cell wall biosynthesis